MSHVHSQKIRRAFYVAGILTGMFLVPEMPVDAANLMVTIPCSSMQISPAALAATMKCSGN